MDYKEYEAGVSQDIFWYRASNNLKKILTNKIIKNKNIKILDIGPGVGDEVKVLSDFGKVYVVDNDKRIINLIDDKFCFKKKIGDACKIPFKDNSFDVVFMFDVIEHIEDDVRVIKEVYRVLKKDGHLIFTVPSCNSLYGNFDIALGHKRRYNKKEIIKLISGFQKVEIGYWNFLLLPLFGLNRLIKKFGTPRVEKAILNPFINNIFYSIFNLENKLIEKNIKLPIGLTIFGIYKKNE